MRLNRGSYNIQLVKDRNGSVFAFEINPRISTTMVVAIASNSTHSSVFRR